MTPVLFQWRQSARRLATRWIGPAPGLALLAQSSSVPALAAVIALPSPVQPSDQLVSTLLSQLEPIMAAQVAASLPVTTDGGHA